MLLLLLLLQVDDANFKKLVAIIRIAVPYTGMILSTRESAEMRDELLKVITYWAAKGLQGGGQEVSHPSSALQSQTPSRSCQHASQQR